MKHLAILLLCLFAVPAGAAFPDAAITAKFKAQADAGNPLANYGAWRLAADPTWFANRTVTDCYMAWLSTGEQKYLDLAIDDHHLPPDISTFNADGTPVRFAEHYDLWHLRDYLLVREHRPAASDAEWRRRLNLRAEQVITEIRIGDRDRCSFTIGYLKILDKFTATTYMQRPQLPPVVEWLNRFMEARFRKGGPRDASSGYEFHTAEQECWMAEMGGKDIHPWFDDFARNYAEWLPKSVSSDYKVAVAWGDQSIDDGRKLEAYHRAPLCFLLAGLGYDPDGKLISLGRKLIGNPTMGQPGSVYPYGGIGFQLVCDPERIMSAPDMPLEDGIFVADGVGVTVLREGGRFVTAVMSNSRLADGTEFPEEDHHYAGAKDHYTWWENGTWLVPQPMGYGHLAGGASNEFFTHNAWCFKCDGWFWPRFFAGTNVTPTGFFTRGEAYGPSQRAHHALGEWFRWPQADVYRDCRITSDISFDREKSKLVVLSKWTSPGDTFPEWTRELPVLQRCQYAPGPITDDGEALTWTAGDFAVRCEYKLTDATGKPVTPNVVTEYAPWYANTEGWRAFIQSPPDLLAGSLELQITRSEVADPTEPDEPLPPVDPPPAGDVQILDKATLTGTWIDWTATGINGGLSYASPGANTATWTATVKPGKYRVAATWPEYENRATNVTYRVGGLTVTVNQELAPASFEASEVRWETLGEVDAADKLMVVLDAAGADEFVIADAVRFERIGEVTGEIKVQGVLRGRQLIIELPPP